MLYEWLCLRSRLRPCVLGLRLCEQWHHHQEEEEHTRVANHFGHNFFQPGRAGA